MKCSIVTCVSDISVYENFIKSVNKCRGEHDVSFIPVFNLESLYTAPLANNIGLKASKSDIVIFCHQDIILLGDWFTNLEETLSKLPDNWAILGSAGVSMECTEWPMHNHIVGTVWHDAEDDPYWNGASDITEVHCVDECLFVFNKKTELTFDNAFNGFHFYGVDLCLQARYSGYGVYGASLPIVHDGRYSNSMLRDRRYWLFFKKLYNKWGLKFPMLFGTHMFWDDGLLTTCIPLTLECSDGYRAEVSTISIGGWKR